jgi:hypothetical protein
MKTVKLDGATIGVRHQHPCTLNGAKVSFGADDVQDYLEQHGPVSGYTDQWGRRELFLVDAAKGAQLHACPTDDAAGISWLFGVTARGARARFFRDLGAAARAWLAAA